MFLFLSLNFFEKKSLQYELDVVNAVLFVVILLLHVLLFPLS